MDQIHLISSILYSSKINTKIFDISLTKKYTKTENTTLNLLDTVKDWYSDLEQKITISPDILLSTTIPVNVIDFYFLEQSHFNDFKTLFFSLKNDIFPKILNTYKIGVAKFNLELNKDKSPDHILDDLQEFINKPSKLINSYHLNHFTRYSFNTVKPINGIEPFSYELPTMYHNILDSDFSESTFGFKPSQSLIDALNIHRERVNLNSAINAQPSTKKQSTFKI